MRKLIFVIFVLSLINKGWSQVERDKALHFIGGNLYGLAGAGIAKQISDGNRWWTFAGSIGGATLIGLGKEAVDAGQRENGWDNDDLLATILGGATVGVTIDIFTDHKRNKKIPQGSIALHSNQEKHQQAARLDKLLEIHRTPSLFALSLPSDLLE